MATLADDIRKVLPPWPSWLPPLPSWIPIAKGGPSTITPPGAVATGTSGTTITVTVPITTVTPTPINVTTPVSASYPSLPSIPQIPTTPVVSTTPVSTSPYAPPVAGTAYTLQFIISPPGGGTITAFPSQANYAPGQIITLTETPASGYSFAGWGGINLSSQSPTSPTVQFNVQGNSQVSASFSPTALAATQAQINAYVAAGRAQKNALGAYQDFEQQWYENASADLPNKPASLGSVSWPDIAEVYMVLNMGQPYSPVYTSGVTLTSAQIADCMTAGAAYVQWRAHYNYAEFWGATQAGLDAQLASLKANSDAAQSALTAAEAPLVAAGMSGTDITFLYLGA
jgi:hypothetical protein